MGGWGSPPDLSSSLGSSTPSPGTVTSNGVGWGGGVPVLPAPPKPSGGGGFFGSITDPGGFFSGLGNLAYGMASSFGSPIYMAVKTIAEGTASALADVAGLSGAKVWSPGWGQVGKDAVSTGQQVGNIGPQVATGVVEPLLENQASAMGVGAQFRSDVVEPFNKFMGESNLITPEMRTVLKGPEGKGYAPLDWWDDARQHGVAAASLNTAAQVAAVAGMSAGITEAGAGYYDAAAAKAADAGALDQAASYADRAEKLRAMTDALHASQQYNPTAHPINAISFAGSKAAQLIQAARDEAFPAEIGKPLDVTQVSPEVKQAAEEVANPDTVAADHVVAQVDPQLTEKYPISPELAAAQAAMEQHAALATFEEGPVPEGMTRLYRVGQELGGYYTDTAPNAARATGTAVEDLGKVSHIDVPNDVAAAHKLPDGNYDMGAEALNYESVQHPEAPPEPGPTELPKSEAQVEPKVYKVNKGKVLTPEEQAVADAQLRERTDNARSIQDLGTHVLDRTHNLVQMPTPQWARNIVEALPPSVTKLIARAGNVVDGKRMRDVNMALQRLQQTAQYQSRVSTAMEAGKAAAHVVLDRHMTRDAASEIIGEEITARLNGESMLAEWTKLVGNTSPEEATALMDAARGDYPGIPREVWDGLAPQERVKLQQALNQATADFKIESLNAQNTLLASRYGAQSLEQALLGKDEVTMTPEQIRLFRRMIRDERFAAKARERIPREIEKRLADAEKAEAMGERAHGVADKIRAQLGFTRQTADDLFRGIALGLERDGAPAISGILAALASDGGAIYDVGANRALHPTDGILVGEQPQFSVPIAQWQADGANAIHEALFNPTASAGRTYDVQRLWGGQDARLVVQIAGDHINGYIGQSTIHGDPIQPWQAHILGAASDQAQGFNFGTGTAMDLTHTADEQNLLKHYLHLTLDPNSTLSKWASNRMKVVADNGLNITPEQMQSEMLGVMWLDDSMMTINPKWQTGNLFKTTMSFAKGESTLPSLAQTVMETLSTGDHVDKAMTSADAESVSKMLRWYYDSHDFIERLYRGKTIPFTGRDAAETMYDLIALSSVMASPTQNLGRALAGLANVNDFLGERQASVDNARAIVDDALAGIERSRPNDVVYVRNLGVRPEDVPRNPNESEAAYNKRVARSIEQEGSQGNGTPVSRRWLGDIGNYDYTSRKLSAQTSMTTGPKYKIIDALTGRFNLETANAEDIGGQPEWWSGNPQHFSDENLAPEAIIHHAQLLGITGPEFETFKAWALNHERIASAADVKTSYGSDYVQPIKTSENQGVASDSVYGQGRQVSSAEHQEIAAKGRDIVERAKAGASDAIDLTKEDFIQSMYNATRELWGGGTLDTHTGQFVPVDDAATNPDDFAVSTKPRTGAGKTSVAIDPTANYATFKRSWLKAVRQWGDNFRWQDAGFGVFHDQKPDGTQMIELDPVLVTHSASDTEAVGAYTHATGAAFNFKTMHGLWTPHVADDEVFSSNDKARKYVAQSERQGVALAKAGPMRSAYENALMEYHGSSLLAKLRSFRDNLAHPETSLAVTLDSIMAQLFGFGKTHWGLKGEYAKYSDQIRQAAARWSTVAGRPVMPHEIQALLWVYAKKFIGEQDWGRLQAHLSDVHDQLNTMEQSNGPLDVKQFDPLGPWWKEELQFSRDQLAVRTERKELRAKRTAGTMTGAELNRLDYLESVPDRQESTIRVQRAGQPITTQSRTETSYDAKELSQKEAQYVEYLSTVVKPMRAAIADGNFDEARRIINEYVAKRYKSIMGGVEGTAFGPSMVADLSSVGAQALERLQQGGHIPAPNDPAMEEIASLRRSQQAPSANPDGLTTKELLDSFQGKTRGETLATPNKFGYIVQRLFATGDISTLLHEDLHALRLMAPGDFVAELSREYPHIQDETLNPLRVADEERFVRDFMGFLYSRTHGEGDMPQSLGLRNLFINVADVMERSYGANTMTEQGRAAPPAITSMWDRIFNRDIVAPDAIDDPLAAQYSPETPRSRTPMRQRWENDNQYTSRVQRYGQSQGQIREMVKRVADAEQQARRADTFTRRMQAAFQDPTRSEIIASKLEDRASRTAEKINNELANPTGNQVPRAWRPYMEAIDRIAAEIKLHPELAAVADEIPHNFSEALRFAAERGFDPTYMPELTWEQSQKYLYGHLTLGVDAREASMRKPNMGVVNRLGLQARNLEALGAGTVIAMQELLRSTQAQFIEDNWARDVIPGQAIPEGWKAWDPAKEAVLTGRKLVDDPATSINATRIIPDSVWNALKGMERPQVDTPFRFLFKGGAIQAWKHLLLTYSPTWYLMHTMGATSLATLEGARFQDFRKAWSRFKANDLPEFVKGREFYAQTAGFNEAAGTLIDRPLQDTLRAEGISAAKQEFNNRLYGIVRTVDALARTAVYEHELRTSGDVAQAVDRAHEAIGDFNRLGPWERGAVTEIMPFYGFTKAMFRILTRMPIEHPLVSAMSMQLFYMNQAYIKQQYGLADIPSAYEGLTPLNGKLVELNKLDPLTSGAKLLTPEGIAGSLNPFVRIALQEGLDAGGFNSIPGMDQYGGLTQKPDVLASLLDMYSGNVPGVGKGLFSSDMLNPTNTLSDKQIASLVKRVAKTQQAEATVAAGGYIDTSAVKPKAAPGLSSWTGQSGGSSASSGRSSRAGIGSGVRTPRIRRASTGKIRLPRARLVRVRKAGVRRPSFKVRAPHIPGVSTRGLELASFKVHTPKVKATRVSTGRSRGVGRVRLSRNVGTRANTGRVTQPHIAAAPQAPAFREPPLHIPHPARLRTSLGRRRRL